MGGQSVNVYLSIQKRRDKCGTDAKAERQESLQ
jgi:hypothetical protein